MVGVGLGNEVEVAGDGEHLRARRADRFDDAEGIRWVAKVRQVAH